MFFKDSCITKLTAISALEEATRIPEHNFPVYIGSGNLIMSVDSSGLQSLNHGVQEPFCCMPHAGDMYVVSHGMVSDHIDPMNTLPYGYFTWNMDMDGMLFSPDNLVSVASNFSRKILLDEGRVITKLMLASQAIIEFDLCMPLHQNCLIMKIRTQGYDYENKPIHPVRTGKLEILLHLTSRSGKKLYDCAELSGSSLNISVKGLEDYKYTIKADSDADAAFSFQDGVFQVVLDTQAGNQVSEYTVIYDFDGQKSVSDVPSLLRENKAFRKETYRKLASFKGLDVKEEFLYNNSLYLLMSGFDLKKGLPIGMPFYFPWCWKASTFWDSHFVMDGLMRAGGKEQADTFLRFIFSALKQQGKPFSWMFNYKSIPTVEDDRDIAPLVMCAHAMTAIKHYEYFRDEKMLSEMIYPIVERVSEFASRTLYSKVDGKWILSMPVSNDVVEEQAEEINQTFTTLWFLVIFRKTLEFQKILGLQQDPLLLEITSNYQIEHNQEEYLHCRGMTAQQCKWASWVPFLCYPTEAMPFMDMDLFDKTRKKYTYPRLYMEKQGSYQPWTEFMEAGSDFRRGAIEEGFRLRELGMSHVFGVGFFSEIGPRQQTCGLPPYISAHGTFLSSLIYQFISTSIWDNTLEVFSKMPRHYHQKDLSLKNIYCSGVCILEAELGKFETKVKLRPTGPMLIMYVSMQIPYLLDPELMRVEADGEPLDYRWDPENRCISFQLQLKDVAEIRIF